MGTLLSQPILKPYIVRQFLATLLRVTETVLNRNVVFSTKRLFYLNYKLCILRHFLLVTLFRLTENVLNRNVVFSSGFIFSSCHI
jgi:hypothetical protein